MNPSSFKDGECMKVRTPFFLVTAGKSGLNVTTCNLQGTNRMLSICVTVTDTEGYQSGEQTPAKRRKFLKRLALDM